MPVCTVCGHDNKPGALHCAQCYMLFTTQEANQAGPSKDQATQHFPLDDATRPRLRLKHTGKLSADSLALYIDNNSDPIIIQLVNEAILGRYAPGVNPEPRVDLAPYDGQARGVSRVHAAIRRGADGSLYIVDLGSSNGTWLNGERLAGQQPYKLHAADRVILSQIQIEIYFEEAGKGTVTNR